MEDRESIERVAEDAEDEVEAHHKRGGGHNAADDAEGEVEAEYKKGGGITDDDFEAHRKHAGGVN